MRGAIVHEWIAKSGGSENVFEAMAEAFPEADLHCLWNDDPTRFTPRRVQETWLAKSPLRRNKALALPLMPLAWRTLKSAASYDWILVSSHLFAHHATFLDQTNIPKYVYTHTPARYIWSPELDGRGRSLPVRLVSETFEGMDARRAGEALEVAANSEFIRQRIMRVWGRDSRVIYPPVEVEKIQSVVDWANRLTVPEELILQSLPDDFVLGASRFVSYKGLDRVIQVGEVLQLPVVLAGSGPEEDKLRSIAANSNVPVIFVERPSSNFLYALYQRCLLYVFPPVEDFGIMPVEAMAAGAPVLANRTGGAAESVVEGLTGSLVDFTSTSELEAAAATALAADRSDCARRAQIFSKERFSSNIRSWLPNSASATVGARL